MTHAPENHRIIVNDTDRHIYMNVHTQVCIHTYIYMLPTSKPPATLSRTQVLYPTAVEAKIKLPSIA